VATEAANGFAQPALRASAPLLREKARRQGISAVAIRNSHHFAAVWPDIEPFAAEGFIALAMVNGSSSFRFSKMRRAFLVAVPCLRSPVSGLIATMLE
jgi:LDH2 family malate/lactate/ureidoglycolate dehydrogenase